MNGDVPGFDLPWHAQVYALARACEAAGMFTSVDWSDALGAALADAREAGGAVDGGAGYWAAWQAALEGLIAARSDVSDDDLSQTAEAWRAAYLSTPHGAPVRISDR